MLKTGLKCSFITHKLRFFACFCLVSAASKTFFNGLLSHDEVKIGRAAEYQAFLKDPVNRRPNGAELLDDFIQRIGSAYEETIERYQGSHFLIVAHAGVMRAIIAKTVYASPAGLYRIKISNGGITRIRHTETGGVLELLNGKLSA